MRLPIAAIMFLTATPVQGHCYSVWHYNYPQRCAARVTQREEPPPPIPPVWLQDQNIDIPLPSLEHMEFPPDCNEDWCQRMKGIGLLREKLGTN